MQRNAITREEVSETLVTDKFFIKGNLTLKIRQSILTLFSWMGVLLPFVWVLLPVLYPETASRIGFIVYQEQIITFRFLLIFFLIAFVVIFFVSISLTIWNNHKYKKVLQRTVTIDEDSVDLHNALLEDFYSERFGEKNVRESIRFYSVAPEKNITDDDVIHLYRNENK